MARCRLHIPVLQNHHAALVWSYSGNSYSHAWLVPFLHAQICPRCKYKAHLIKFKRSTCRKGEALQESK